MKRIILAALVGVLVSGPVWGKDASGVLMVFGSGLMKCTEYQGKFGADIGITAGFYGAGMEASTTTNLKVDVLAFTNAKVGAFAGASLEGAVLARRRDMNEFFYGPGATPDGIVLGGRHQNPKANSLRSVLARF